MTNGWEATFEHGSLKGANDRRRLRLTLSNGMLYFFRMDGEISVILCRRKASQPWELPGKKPGHGNKTIGEKKCSCQSGYAMYDKTVLFLPFKHKI